MIDPGLETKNSTPLTNGGRSDSGQGIDIDIDTVSSSDSNDNAGLMAQLEAMQSKGSKSYSMVIDCAHGWDKNITCNFCKTTT